MKKSIICGALAAVFLLAPAVQARDWHKARGHQPSRHHWQPGPAKWGHQNFHHNRHHRPAQWGQKNFNHNRHHRPPQWGHQKYHQGWGNRQAPWARSHHRQGWQPPRAPWRPLHSYGTHQNQGLGWQHHPGGRTFQRAYSYDQ